MNTSSDEVLADNNLRWTRAAGRFFLIHVTVYLTIVRVGVSVVAALVSPFNRVEIDWTTSTVVPYFSAWPYLALFGSISSAWPTFECPLCPHKFDIMNGRGRVLITRTFGRILNTLMICQHFHCRILLFYPRCCNSFLCLQLIYSLLKWCLFLLRHTLSLI